MHSPLRISLLLACFLIGASGLWFTTRDSRSPGVDIYPAVPEATTTSVGALPRLQAAARDAAHQLLPITSRTTAEAEDPRGRILARLIDKHTSQPVPNYHLRVYASPHFDDFLEDLVSDESGWLSSKHEYGTASLGLELSDVPPPGSMGSAYVLGHDPGALSEKELLIPIPVGPTYTLALDIPSGLESGPFVAFLYTEADAETTRRGVGIRCVCDLSHQEAGMRNMRDLIARETRLAHMKPVVSRNTRSRNETLLLTLRQNHSLSISSRARTAAPTLPPRVLVTTPPLSDCCDYQFSSIKPPTLWMAPVRGVASAGDTSQQASSPWVRFAINFPRLLSRSDGPWRLRVEHIDGLCAGEAEVYAILGVQDKPVHVRMQSLGTIRMHVQDVLGAPVPDVHIQLAVGENSTLLGARQVKSSTAQGNLEIPLLPEGDYSLRVSRPGFIDEYQSLYLGQGQILDIDILLRPRPRTQTISGVVTSESGDFHGSVGLIIEPLELDLPGLRDYDGMTRVDWKQQNGHWVGSFSLPDLPAGRFKLRPKSQALVHISPAEIDVRAPAQNLQFQIQDGTGGRLFFRVLDAASGKLIRRVNYRLERGSGPSRQLFGGQRRQTPRHRFDSPIAAGIKASEALWWSVEADGYVAQIGDLTQFIAVDGQPANILLCTLHLEAVAQAKRD